MEITTLLLNIVLPWEPLPGSPPHLCNLPLGEDHTLHPRTGVRGSRGGPSPPLPHSSAGLAPLALVTPGCWALRLLYYNKQNHNCSSEELKFPWHWIVGAICIKHFYIRATANVFKHNFVIKKPWEQNLFLGDTFMSYLSEGLFGGIL